MCAVFGLIDYKQNLTTIQREIILSVLSTYCEIRGTDATGFAYNTQNRLCIFKRPLPAHKIKLRLSHFATTIIGHTRMTTQGSENKNYNNHPFYGYARDCTFALAHNGIINNDVKLQKEKKLSDTNIETDSYVAVQLLSQYQTLDFNSIKVMAEQIEGSFVFTVLDKNNNVYFVHGNNPLNIYHFKKHGFYLYASTGDILDKTLKSLGISELLYEKVTTVCGDILKIDDLGQQERDSFNTRNIDNIDFRFFMDYKTPHKNSHAIKQLKEIAKSMGIDSCDIEILQEYGFSVDEIEEMLYNPADFTKALNCYYYDYQYE